MEIEKYVMDRVSTWLEGNYDAETKTTIKELLESNPAEIVESFYKTLEFGTGGLRGKMGVGSNRMNIYTVGSATQGLANYLKKAFADLDQIKVAVACDSRNNSDLFSKTVAEIFAANGFKVFLFESLRPTPELSFAIRELGCQSGVVVTASHNPKIYNGYKAYWSDGGQVVAPHDTNIIDEVNAIESVDDIKWSGGEANITIIGEDVDSVYLDKVRSLSLSPEAIAQNSDMKIVFTSIHGTGITLVPRALKEYGFTNVHVVEEQAEPNGDFPTVISPNPEEASAFKMAIDAANEIGASLAIATDPDADRIGVAVRDNQGEMIILNGNQTASIVTYYILTRMKELGTLKGEQFTVKTIVTTELLVKIAESFGVKCYDVLTGFKHIAAIIKANEGKSQFLCGGEESYGFLVGDFVRDKDAVSCASIVCEAAAWAATKGMTLYQLLIDIYSQYGFYKEGLLSTVKEGKSGAEQIKEIMDNMRATPLTAIDGEAVVEIRDYQSSTITNTTTGATSIIDQPKSDVLQYVTSNGTIVSMRPSGTEPKIKFYFGVREMFEGAAQFDAANDKANERIARIKSNFEIL